MKNLTQKAILFLILTFLLLILLQNFSLASSENIQMIKKGEKQYIIYVSNLLNQEFQFAFANKADEAEENLMFINSAVDQAENGNNIAYIDETLFNTYFDEKADTFLWVKQENDYKVEAEKITLEKAITEELIQNLNNVTKKIPVKFGELNLPAETVEGVKITRKLGTINIDDESETEYSYNMLKSVEESKVEKLINLAETINNLQEKNIYEKLYIYNQFNELYTELIPSDNWQIAENNTIMQPQDSKKGEKYLVWIKGDNVIDLQIMTCNDEYTPEYEKQEVVNKVVTKLPITGESLVLYIVAAVLVIAIITMVIVKVKKNKTNNNE